MIAAFIFSLIAAGLGYCFIRARRSRLENAVVYTATLVGVEEKYRKRGHMLYKVVKPTVKYNNGKRDVVGVYHDWIRAADFSYSSGAQIEIRAYPELPKIVYLAEDDNHVSYEAIACFVAAAAIFMLGVITEIAFG
jgi:hypothetical protein